MKLERGENPCPFGGPITTNEKGQVTMPPDKSKALVGPVDVRKDQMTLSKVKDYTFKEINGEIYRIGKDGVKYTAISKERFEALQKLAEKYFGKDEDQR